LHPSAAKWLVSHREIHGIGIDTASIDYGQSTSFLTHRTLAKENIFFIENLNTREMNIDDLPNPVLIINPLKITSGSGSPVRPILVSGFSYTEVHHDTVQDKNKKLDL
jgi:kynurenine formamidase